MIRKCLAVGIILLFVGVTIAPTINFNTVKASTDDDLIEVTTQACGIKGYGNTTVKLTREQYQNLEQYLVEFRARLNQTSTREETFKIYNEFIVELDNYGLLGGLSVKKAQKLVNGLFPGFTMNKFSDRLLNKVKNLSLGDSNFLCSIYGEIGENTLFQGPIAKIPSKISGLFVLIPLGLFSLLWWMLGSLCIFLSVVFATYINPIQILSTIFYGGWSELPFDPEAFPKLIPASGSVWTLGLFGNKQWNGTFIGKIPTLLTFLSFPLGALLPGVIGFTGLRISSSSLNLYFGTALWVKINEL